MKKPRVQQKTERRISAGLRLALVAVLLLLQIAVVIALSMLLQQKMAIIYTVLELLAIGVAIWVYTRPGSSSYKIGWALLILAVPVAGLILYLLWNSQPVHRSNLKKLPYPPENDERRRHDAATLTALAHDLPKWYRVATYAARGGFAPYSGTDWEYLSTGEGYLEHMLAAMGKAVIVVSSELPELLGICDRIYVMSGGKIAGEVSAKHTTQEEIMTLAAKYV